MANKNLFKSIVGKLLPVTDALNDERAPAYAFEPKHALAQYAATGCMNHTFYASAEEQLAKVLELCAQVEPEFIAKAAVFCREHGFMKDMPALLCAVLSVRDRVLLAQVFPRVIDNGKMLRNFVQIIRSGAVGRKSLGTAPKRLVREWIEARDEARVFPYQLMAAFMAAGKGVPEPVRNALQDAMEIATENVPEIAGKVYVFPDVSGSMRSPVTGYRKGSTSAVRSIDVAALVAATALRKNGHAEVIPFKSKAIEVRLNARDSVMTNAEGTTL